MMCSRWLQYGSIYLAAKSVVFLGLAYAEMTPVSPLLMAGMSVTWLMGAALLGYMRVRVVRYQRAKMGAAPTTRQSSAEPAVANTRPAQTAKTMPTGTAADTGAAPQPSGA